MRLAPLHKLPPSVVHIAARVEKFVLATLFAVLLTIDLQWGLLRRFITILEGIQSTAGSVALAGGFALWVGVFTYAARRRAELREAQAGLAEAEAEAERVGVCDPLTGLPNRRGMQAGLQARIAVMRASGGRAAVIAFDIDRFKTLNEVRGQACGDRVLIELSDRLAVAVRPGDFVARAGPDEFHVLLADVGPDEAMVIASQLQDDVGRPFRAENPPLQIRASVGIAVFDAADPALDVELVMRRVDIALQYAKADGGSGISAFEDDMEMSIRERAQLERSLEVALANGEIQPHFQPVIDLQSNRISGFEVLARWNHPERGPISPSVFIPIAEEMGLLGELTTVILRRACAAARDWPAHIKLAVNISPVDFKNPWLAQEILQTLTEVGFPPQRLELEITENALVVDQEQAMKTITSLKNQGISIALDDFGTGYSSLHHLRVLPFDKIKIDQSFVKTMRDNADSRMIVKAIIGLSGSLGLPTTAEGIETNNNADLLRDLGCTNGQGFLFSKAVPGRDVPTLLSNLAQQAVHPELRPDVEGREEAGLPGPAATAASSAATTAAAAAQVPNPAETEPLAAPVAQSA
ncbi:EAL domain-containing protein [Siculibacillus lacustris]|uniref:EAL domain-containing protein n=1 Tax=Siculibacillus lacustris TaxID=1549641 RepID=A0A4V2KUE0_9HYPH|nr:EAL domain-containing protein [Siculibacillus lacustris]TBW41225.1 EAL domain-containing protein [Siculibacillus lacustris]